MSICHAQSEVRWGGIGEKKGCKKVSLARMTVRPESTMYAIRTYGIERFRISCISFSKVSLPSPDVSTNPSVS